MNLALPLSNRCLSQASMSGSSPSCLVPHQLVYPLGILFYSLGTCELHYTCKTCKARWPPRPRARWLRGSPLAEGVGGSRSRARGPAARLFTARRNAAQPLSTIRFCLKGGSRGSAPPQRAGATAGNPLPAGETNGGVYLTLSLELYVDL